MDAHEALVTRRTVHAWTPGPLPPDVLERALEAAHHAPCHRHTWPWRFTVVGPQTRGGLADLAVDLKGGAATLPAAQIDAIRAKLLDPSELVVVSCVRCDDPVRAHEDHAAVAAAVQNLMLAAWADGVGSKWSTGAVTRAPEAYTALGIDPGLERIEGFIWLGHARRPPPVVPRPPVEQVVRRTP